MGNRRGSVPTEKLNRGKVSVARRRQAQRVIESWFAAQGWKAFPFQKQAWAAALAGKSGLIHATTGTGKTYAAWMAPLIDWMSRQPASGAVVKPTGLRVLWITPLRALVLDTWKALSAPVEQLGIPWTIESRTSDTSAKVRNQQRTRLPNTLITTPESLSLMLTRADVQEQFKELDTIIVDEWHELMGSKRGVQTELGLARVKRYCPNVKIWGLSATLGNLNSALDVLLGSESESRERTIIQGLQRKQIQIDSLIPEVIERFPWSGHIGLRQLEKVVTELDQAQSSLVFTNTRGLAETWYQAILRARPKWAGQMALHHGSLDSETRNWVENGLRQGTLKCVVCTSSLDLGVDFSPVDRVFQVGSPKGAARLLQRAGRSGHSPGRKSRVTSVPTHALELVEISAVRSAIESGHLESRIPPSRPLDVLTQHAVTIAIGGGFTSEELFHEVKSAYSYRDLTRPEWDWILDFITTGGTALRAYPEYKKVLRTDDGRYVMVDKRQIRQHLMSMGTIVSEASLVVQLLNGSRLGVVEDSFLARLNPGDRFTFAGRIVELVSVHDSKVYVRISKDTSAAKIPRWNGGRMPLSSELSQAIREELDLASRHEFRSPEMKSLRPLLELQAAWSAVPRVGQTLIEKIKSREGHHLYIYPFAGRLVHEGLATLLAFRLSRLQPITFSMSVNDYGIELLSPVESLFNSQNAHDLLSNVGVAEDIAQSLNAAEMGRRQFREIAFISGLIFTGYPNQRKTARQLQASTGLLYDVFRNYDPENLLMKQADREVLERQLEETRLVETLRMLQASELVWCHTKRFTPLCFPLLVDRLRERLSSEKLSDRIRRMQESLEKAAGDSV